MRALPLLLLLAPLLLLLLLLPPSLACNEAVCASIVSKCMLLQSCKCDLQPDCTCCKQCFECLALFLVYLEWPEDRVHGLGESWLREEG